MACDRDDVRLLSVLWVLRLRCARASRRCASWRTAHPHYPTRRGEVYPPPLPQDSHAPAHLESAHAHADQAADDTRVGLDLQPLPVHLGTHVRRRRLLHQQIVGHAQVDLQWGRRRISSGGGQTGRCTNVVVLIRLPRQCRSRWRTRRWDPPEPLCSACKGEAGEKSCCGNCGNNGNNHLIHSPAFSGPLPYG